MELTKVTRLVYAPIPAPYPLQEIHREMTVPRRVEMKEGREKKSEVSREGERGKGKRGNIFTGGLTKSQL